MTLKPVFTALLFAGLVAGCVNDQASAPLSTSGAAPAASGPVLLVADGRNVPAGTLCEHLIDRAVNSVAGCEGYVKLLDLTPREAAEIASLNSRFSAEVAPIVNFEFDKADLTPAGAAILDVQAAWILRFVNLRFSVYGHTDLVGSEGYNFDLAKRRAETVVAYLAGKGVPSDQLEALVSYGETKPIIPADQREAQNRRTVTEVTGYVTVPRLRTKVAVACTLVKPGYLASYPSCLAEIKPPVPMPPPPVVYPIVTEVGNITAANTPQETSTSVSIVNDGTSVTTQTKGSAGNGAVTTDVKTVATAEKLVREIRNNGQLVMTVTSNPDGSNPQVEWPN
jgi:outer membrane protein OmpA-like peptidoglycan-associated protein